MIIIVFLVIIVEFGLNQQSIQVSLQYIDHHLNATNQLYSLKLLEKPESINKLSFLNNNNRCSWNISQSASEYYSTVAQALENECIETDGYLINLLDREHVEHLLINNSQSIIIVAIHDFSTVWKIKEEENEIIQVLFGDLSLYNIEFQFSNLVNSTNSIIIPSNSMVNVGNKQFQSSIYINDCIFNQIQGFTDKRIIQVSVYNVDNAFFDNCTFNGIGTNQNSNVSMIYILQCINTNLKSCNFQNTKISSGLEAVHLDISIENACVLIVDCKFTNITSYNSLYSAALRIINFDNLSAQITWNDFTNCSANISKAGALQIEDNFEEDIMRNYKIINNTFRNNNGYHSGAIYCQILTENEKFNFSNNIFISNMNNETKQIGRDAFLFFNEPPVDWTLSSTLEMITDWFNGSTSDAEKDSVYFQAQRSMTMFMSGSITLQHPSNWGKLSTTLLIGIIVGSVVIVASIVIIIIIAVVNYKKKKQFQQTENLENYRLIQRTSYRSI